MLDIENTTTSTMKIVQNLKIICVRLILATTSMMTPFMLFLLLNVLTI